MQEVHLFLGEGTIGQGNALGFAPGGRHRILVFVRQPAGAEHDFALATKRAQENGLVEVMLDQGGTFQAESLGSMSAHLIGAYQRAVSLGTGNIVYSQAGEPKSAGPAPNG